MSDGAALRVLYSFPDTVGKPGIGTTALQQVRSLDRAGASVTLVCTTLTEPVPESVRVIETLRLCGRRVPHRAFGSPERAAAYHDWRAARVLSDARFDVVHAWPGAASTTIVRARQLRVLASREVPNTHTGHAMAVSADEAHRLGMAAAKGTSHAYDPGRLGAEEKEFAAADVLMVPSEHVAQTFLERGVAASRLARHQYGYDPDRFHGRGRADGAGRRFAAVFVGTAEPRKGLHYALEAWGRSAPPGGTFKIAGRFQPGYGDAIGRLLRQPGVQVLDFVEDVPALLRASDVLLLPSVEEGSALVTYEAQGSGCIPLVSTAAGAVLPADCVGALEHAPRDVDTLAAQLAAVAADTDVRSRLRRQVMTHARALTWDASGQIMLERWRERLER